jgi:antitoxin component YwqK of YwqJK toxin-antitoxin module
LEYDNWSQTGSNPKDGRFRRYWPNGNLRYEWYYKDGTRADGISKGWWYNGNLKQTITWKNGKKVGLFTAWYENGQMMAEGNYKVEERDGKRIEYDAYGKKSEEIWKDGKLWDGKWIENGQKKSEKIYKKGKLISEMKRLNDKDI